MKPPRREIWRKRALLLATAVAVVLLASHPELRMLAPLVDAFGLDALVLLLGAQVWSSARPVLATLYRSAAVPSLRFAYAAIIFLFGLAGPFVDAKFCAIAGRGVS